MEQLLTVGVRQVYADAATGRTVQLLRTELRQQGLAMSERTIRRTLPRSSWRWERPKFVKFVPGGAEPAYAERKA